MTLEQWLDVHRYPQMAELVLELKSTINDHELTHTPAGVEAKLMLDEIRHLVVAATKFKEAPE